MNSHTTIQLPANTIFIGSTNRKFAVEHARHYIAQSAKSVIPGIVTCSVEQRLKWLEYLETLGITHCFSARRDTKSMFDWTRVHTLVLDLDSCFIDMQTVRVKLRPNQPFMSELMRLRELSEKGLSIPKILCILGDCDESN